MRARRRRERRVCRPALGLFLCGFALADFGDGVHGAAAFFGAAVAEGFIVAAIVEVIIVGQLGAGGDRFDGSDEYAATLDLCFAVGIAAVVDKHGFAVAVDDGVALAESKEIGDGGFVVHLVGFGLAEARAGVLGDAAALGDRGGGVAACGVDRGRADDECHRGVRCFP